ncbi:MAG: GntR family transcriptional regulator [Deltaproteobacteria bacterium]|nr:GntR family transcriptional regulator [Deltaproteobacteria bacterium]MBW1962576.1 GntR family transcriptional regulator [Deltaproteobacteria bacterium]MBW1996014.1 GntR family transcriptional regulator [Deltaproteobacteria bacterium]MBW2153950.1 GntR family transcriptional regulator [Deltaproteobacteria bacterium]
MAGMTLKENVSIQMRRAIAQGEYRPGERLTEKALCERFNVSRTPVREALRELQAEGLVTISPDLGASVVKLTREDLNNLYDVLIPLEGTACSLASIKMNAEQILQLENCHFKIIQAAAEKNYDLLFELNCQFHSLIVESTANPYLIQMRNNIGRLTNRFGRFTLTAMVPGQIQATLEEHPEVIEAIKNGNPGTAEFQGRKHMESAKKFTLEYYDRIGELLE